MGKVGAEHVAKMLADAQWEVRATAVQTLGTMEAGVDHAEAVAEKLKDNDGRVRSCAVAALGALGEQGAACAGALLSELLSKDGSTDVCWAALEAVSVAGPAA